MVCGRESLTRLPQDRPCRQRPGGGGESHQKRGVGDGNANTTGADINKD